jgi:hypothetical protein
VTLAWRCHDAVSTRPARTPVNAVTGIALGALAIFLGLLQGPFGAWSHTS